MHINEGMSAKLIYVVLPYLIENIMSLWANPDVLFTRYQKEFSEISNGTWTNYIAFRNHGLYILKYSYEKKLDVNVSTGLIEKNLKIKLN